MNSNPSFRARRKIVSLELPAALLCKAFIPAAAAHRMSLPATWKTAGAAHPNVIGITSWERRMDFTEKKHAGIKKNMSIKQRSVGTQGKPLLLQFLIASCNQTSQWKTPELNGGFNGKIIYKWWIFNCHVWLLRVSALLRWFTHPLQKHMLWVKHLMDGGKNATLNSKAQSGTSPISGGLQETQYIYNDIIKSNICFFFFFKHRI